MGSTSRSANLEQLRLRSSRHGTPKPVSGRKTSSAINSSRHKEPKKEPVPRSKRVNPWSLFEETIKGIDEVPTVFSQHYRKFKHSTDFQQTLNDMNYELPEVMVKKTEKPKKEVENDTERNSAIPVADELFIADLNDVTEDSLLPPISADEESSIGISEELQSRNENIEDHDFMAVTELASNMEDIRKELYDRYINQSNQWAGNLKKYLPQALSKQRRDRSKSAFVRKESRSSSTNFRAQSAFVFDTLWE